MKLHDLLEALTRDQKEKVDNWRENNPPVHHEITDKIFGNTERIYLPFSTAEAHDKIVIPPELQSYLLRNGYNIKTPEDYLKGIAYNISDEKNRPIGIGKILTRYLGADENILKLYANDPQRKGAGTKQYKICITRNPYDVAGMSTDRGWTSCMDLNGGHYCEYIENDLKYGTLVAYLIKPDDVEIENPICRVNIKPFVNQEDASDIIYATEGRVYDADVPGFLETVDAWCERILTPRAESIYLKSNNTYDDNSEKSAIMSKKLNTAKQVFDLIDKITSKGIPDQRIIQLVVKEVRKFSFMELFKFYTKALKMKEKVGDNYGFFSIGNMNFFFKNLRNMAISGKFIIKFLKYFLKKPGYIDNETFVSDCNKFGDEQIVNYIADNTHYCAMLECVKNRISIENLIKNFKRVIEIEIKIGQYRYQDPYFIKLIVEKIFLDDGVSEQEKFDLISLINEQVSNKASFNDIFRFLFNNINLVFTVNFVQKNIKTFASLGFLSNEYLSNLSPKALAKAIFYSDQNSYGPSVYANIPAKFIPVIIKKKRTMHGFDITYALKYLYNQFYKKDLDGLKKFIDETDLTARDYMIFFDTWVYPKVIKQLWNKLDNRRKGHYIDQLKDNYSEVYDVLKNEGSLPKTNF